MCFKMDKNEQIFVWLALAGGMDDWGVDRLGRLLADVPGNKLISLMHKYVIIGT